MSFPKYPEYKDSGVEWLGEVPNHWVKSSIKHVAAINMGQSPNSDDCNTDGVGLPFLQGNGEFGTKYPTPKQYCPVARKIADAGDLLFSVRAPVGALNEADQIYGIGRGLCAMKASRDISKEFLWWFLSSSQSFLDSISTGSTFEAVSAEQVANIAIALPRGVVEQTQIAHFLDHETARIDALIEEQRRLIELLKEKRQAVISHAVTKGLDPTVPMKDSGVEWLGEVPAHWEVKKLKNVTLQIIDGAHFTPTYVDDGVPFIRVTDIQTQFLDMDNIKRIPEHEHLELIKRCKPEWGDVLLSKNGTIGITKIVDWDFEFSIFVSLCLIKPALSVSSRYLLNMLSSNSALEQFRDSGQKTSVTNLHLEKIREIFVALPCAEEQSEISDFIDEKTKELDVLISEAISGNSLLQERRSALISAAVTGKIDVRGWQPPASIPAPEPEQEAV